MNINTQIIKLNKQGLTAYEISKKLGISLTTVYRKGKLLNLKFKSKNDILKVNYDDITYYHSLGMNDAVIAKKLNVARETVVKHRNKLGLKSNTGVYYESTKLTFEEEQVILGGLLGDLHLSKSDKGNPARGMFAHCLEQSDFVDYKYNFIKRFCKIPYNSETIDRRNNKKYYRRNCIIYTNPVFDYYINEFYKNKIKIVPENLIQKLEPLGLAIWYMDDGSKCKSGYYLHTNSFNNKDLEILRKLLLNKFKIKTSIHKGNILYIPKESRDTFRNLIKPYIIECMEYKL